MRCSLLLVLLAFFFAAPAVADGAQSVPDSTVTLRVLSRDDAGFVVELSNPSDRPAPFDSVGLYFLPSSKNEEDPPQRLGVVSAGQVASGSSWQAASEVVTLTAHETVRMKLAAYCLDEHRAGPAAGTRYFVAMQRMPLPLKNALRDAARKTPEDVQTSVWRVRANMPVTLLGER